VGVRLVWPGNCVERADRTNDTKTKSRESVTGNGELGWTLQS